MQWLGLLQKSMEDISKGFAVVLLQDYSCQLSCKISCILLLLYIWFRWPGESKDKVDGVLSWLNFTLRSNEKLEMFFLLTWVCKSVIWWHSLSCNLHLWFAHSTSSLSRCKKSAGMYDWGSKSMQQCVFQFLKDFYNFISFIYNLWPSVRSGTTFTNWFELPDNTISVLCRILGFLM